jgi:hypothetical protein
MGLLFLIAIYAWIKSPDGQAIVLTEEEIKEMEE